MKSSPCSPRLPRLHKLSTFCAALLLAGSAFTHNATADTALSFTSPNGSFLDGNSRMIGWQFQLARDSEVTHLGWQDLGLNGLNVAHEVGIWTSSGTLLGSAVVPAGTVAGLDGFFRYVELAAAIDLSAATTYVIAGFDPGSGDAHVWDANVGLGAQVNGFAVDDDLVLGAVGTARGASASSFVFPNSGIGDGRRAMMGPNFQFNPSAPVPVPAGLPLLVGGLAALGLHARRRARG